MPGPLSEVVTGFKYFVTVLLLPGAENLEAFRQNLQAVLMNGYQFQVQSAGESGKQSPSQPGGVQLHNRILYFELTAGLTPTQAEATFHNLKMFDEGYRREDGVRDKLKWSTFDFEDETGLNTVERGMLYREDTFVPENLDQWEQWSEDGTGT